MLRNAFIVPCCWRRQSFWLIDLCWIYFYSLIWFCLGFLLRCRIKKNESQDKDQSRKSKDVYSITVNKQVLSTCFHERKTSGYVPKGKSADSWTVDTFSESKSGRAQLSQFESFSPETSRLSFYYIIESRGLKKPRILRLLPLGHIIAAGGRNLFLFLREHIHWQGSIGLWTRFYYLGKCGHDFIILAGCGHDFTDGEKWIGSITYEFIFDGKKPWFLID